MRLFFGLSLPSPIRQAVFSLAAQAQSRIPGRYVPAENYHVTLAFLGDVPPERLALAQEALACCARDFPVPRLSPLRLDVFGRPQNGILVLRMESDPPLDALHESLVQTLQAFSLPADPGPFSPHVTLARHACASVGALDAPCAQTVPAFIAQEAHVFLSARNERDILHYTPLFSTSFNRNM